MTLPREHFTIFERRSVLHVPVDSVLFLRAELKYLTVRTAEREYLLEDSLTRIEKGFPSRFVRIHRNCIVAKNAIVALEKIDIENKSGWVVKLDRISEALPVSRHQKQHSFPGIRFKRKCGPRNLVEDLPPPL